MFNMENEYNLIVDLDVDSIGSSFSEDFDDNSYDYLYNMFLNMHNRVDNFKGYEKVKVCSRWNKYSNFCSDIKSIPNWNTPNWGIDKDLLSPKFNLIYSPETVCFLPSEINTQLAKYTQVSRFNKLPFTRYKHNKGGYSTVKLHQEDEVKYFETEIEAFFYVRYIKHAHLVKLANKHKEHLPAHVYKELCSYKIGFDH